jgi:hypothetical protein
VVGGKEGAMARVYQSTALIWRKLLTFAAATTIAASVATWGANNIGWLTPSDPQTPTPTAQITGVGGSEGYDTPPPTLTSASPEPVAPAPVPTTTTQAVPPASKIITYSVSLDGNVSVPLAEFGALADQTLNDPRGWYRADVGFQQVAENGQMQLVLAEASRLPSYSPVCSAQWSCQPGYSGLVVINVDRWLGGTDSWAATGLPLRDYQHMVINHEVGHFLGHRDNETVCSAPGALAPIMQQQSMDLRGCQLNPWPLDSELWVTV